MPFKRVCVFCGAKPGLDPLYVQSAEQLAEEFKRRNINLVYGGGGVGMMGTIARKCLEAGLEVDGVIPRTLVAAEAELKECTRLHEVDSMHERKALMNELSDAIITLPGGIGSLEELFEVWTWAYLGIHDKPIGILNVSGFFDELIAFIDKCVVTGFLTQQARDLVVVADTPTSLLDQLEAHNKKGLQLSWAPKNVP